MKNGIIKIASVMFGALTFALLSLSCCVAPLLFIIFGISAASLSFLDFLAPYRFVFVLLSICSIVYSFWRIYISQKPLCNGAAISAASLKTLFWLLTALSAISLIYPFIDGIIFAGDME